LAKEPNLSGDSTTSAIWLRRSADQGVLQAQFRLAELYREGRIEHKKRREQAVLYYALAAAQDYSPAQFYLGWAYDTGFGVRQNSLKAASWYLKAAEQGQVDAQINLALKYIDGRGIGKDVVQARRWLARAAQQNSALAQYELGKLYASNSGQKANFVEAYVWTSLAAQQGFTAAVEERKMVQGLLEPSERKHARALLRKRDELFSQNTRADRIIRSKNGIEISEPISGLERVLPRSAQ
jgi:TPR repeat protein|tara:strand:+ start:722 stop:1438 length:717 start_codon:yes stop_codon:yes gene_type:complete